MEDRDLDRSGGQTEAEVAAAAAAARQACGASWCRNVIITVVVLTLVAAALALTGGIMDLCGAGDAQTNGGLATAGGALALIAFVLAVLAAYYCACTYRPCGPPCP